jgi:hypothetical protein
VNTKGGFWVENKNNQNKKIDSILITLVIILLLKITIDQFFFDLLPTLADNIFWVLISVILVINFFKKKSYIYLVITLVILSVGLSNF